MTISNYLTQLALFHAAIPKAVFIHPRRQPRPPTELNVNDGHLTPNANFRLPPYRSPPPLIIRTSGLSGHLAVSTYDSVGTAACSTITSLSPSKGRSRTMRLQHYTCHTPVIQSYLLSREHAGCLAPHRGVFISVLWGARTHEEIFIQRMLEGHDS